MAYHAAIAKRVISDDHLLLRSLPVLKKITGADPGFQERGFICIKGGEFSLLILSCFS